MESKERRGKEISKKRRMGREVMKRKVKTRAESMKHTQAKCSRRARTDPWTISIRTSASSKKNKPKRISKKQHYVNESGEK